MDNEFKIINRAIQLVELGKFKLALDLIEANFSLLEDLGPLHQMQAFCYLQLEDYDKAIMALKTALDKNPEDVGSHFLLGSAYSAKGKIDLAVKSFSLSLELNPDFTDAHIGLARLYLVQENTRHAKVHIDHAIKIEPNNEQALLVKSVLEKQLGFDKESKATLLRGLEINPLNTGLLFEKANRDLKAENPEHAQEIYQQLILENPGNFILEEKIIESSLSNNWLYRNLLYKYRLFSSTSYLLPLFVLAMILFGGGFYSSFDKGSQAGQVWKNILLIVSMWSAIFWIGRLITHGWMVKKIWNKPMAYYFNPYYAASLYIFLGLVYFILFLTTDASMYFAFAGFLALFSVLFLGFLLIDRKLTKRLFSAWIAWLHIAGVVSLLYSTNESSESVYKFLASGDLLAFSLLIPFIVAVIYIGGKGIYEDWVKGKRSKHEKKVEEELKIPNWHIALYAGIFLSFISIRVAYSFIGQNILNPLVFYSFWILFPLGVMLYLYQSGKMTDWYRRYLSRFNYDANYISNFFLISGIFTIILSVVIGFLIVNFMVFSRQEIQTKLLRNGYLQQDPESFLLVEYNGYEERISPRNIREFPRVDTGTVKLMTHKSFLGVTIADSIFLVSPTIIKE